MLQVVSRFKNQQQKDTEIITPTLQEKKKIYIRMSKEIEIAPLRTLDDFILSQSRQSGVYQVQDIFTCTYSPIFRFEIPDYHNLDKFRNRVVSNLIYYQTNYALSAIILFSIITLLNPLNMALGMLTMILSKNSLNQSWT